MTQHYSNPARTNDSVFADCARCGGTTELAPDTEAFCYSCGDSERITVRVNDAQSNTQDGDE